MNLPHRARFWLRSIPPHPGRLLIALVVGATVVAAVPLARADSSPANAAEISASTGPAAPPSGALIALDQIAPRVTDTAALLRSAASHLAPGDEIQRIERSLPALAEELSLAMGSTLRLLSERPSLETLQAQQGQWEQRQRELVGWLAILTAQATRLQGDLDLLTQQRGLWTETRAALQGQGVPVTLMAQMNALIAAIQAAMPHTQEARDRLLDLQARVAEQLGHCERVRARIDQSQQAAVGGILARDGLPFWSPALWARATDALTRRVAEIGRVLWGDVRLYVTDPAGYLPVHLGVFVLGLAALLTARRSVAHWALQGQDVSRLMPVFDRPVAAALLVALAVATGYDSPAPQMVQELFDALVLVPMVLLARAVLGPVVRPALYTLALLFAFDIVRRAFAGDPPPLGQTVILVQAVVGGLVLLPLIRIRGTAAPGSGAFWRLVGVLVLGVFAVGFAASLFGYLSLARLTTPAVLVGAADALWLFAVVEIATAVTAFAFRVWPLRRLHMIAHHQGRLERQVYRLFLVLAALAWSWRYLSYLGLWEPIVGLVEVLLATRLQIGAFATSVADGLAFIATLAVAFGLSALLRFVLEEEVYPRTGIPGGTAYATSGVLHYAIVTLAFLLALGILGVSLTQVTVLAGALGVGLGFGLQGIVHNFVSGLILLFERPIHVGDAVQVGTLQGWVRRIGIRASVIRTVQGAEIIVPNSQLTSEQVTNWTLSDRQRRIDLPVGLSYGSAPSQVIALLEGVARAHPGVLQSPPPQCLFMGYGDSAINFELRVWTDYAVWIQVQSELMAAIYDAVYAAGMSFPFPQREVRLLSDPTPPPAGVADVDTGTK